MFSSFRQGNREWCPRICGLLVAELPKHLRQLCGMEGHRIMQILLQTGSERGYRVSDRVSLFMIEGKGGEDGNEYSI
jgi:hypothetical protein